MISFDGFVPGGNAPIYLQINSFIKRGIVAGGIKDGDELPSRRMLSVLLGINPNTVQKSYALLEEEGLLHSRPGAKSCVAVTEEALQRLKQELLEAHLRSMIDGMKQMGMTCAQAQAALETLWEVEA